MKFLKDLLEGLGVSGPVLFPAGPITGIAVDSRRVQPGNLFIALRGSRHDGHDRVDQAVRAGAVALLAERPLAGVSVPVGIVPSTAAVLSTVAARFFDFPSQGLEVVGVTGTNGKTTLTYLLEKVWQTEGVAGGVIGTIHYRWPGHVEKAVNTTPNAFDLQRLLAALAADGVRRVAMEVSSHALSLGRVEDVSFSVGVVTNLTQDHLDFHRDMEGYFQAKARLFELLSRSSRPVRHAVVNADDPWAPRFLEKIHGPVWTYGLDAKADFRAEDMVLSAEGSRFRAVTPFGNEALSLSLVGRYNVSNALAALAAATALGVSLPTAVAGLDSLAGVPGRLERVTEHPAGSPQASQLPFSVFVDYAHTEDALRNVLEAMRPLTRGRLVVVFGCGGDRDKTKRPKMGERAASLADHVVVTSDNPRSEDPVCIADEVAAGVRRVRGASHEVIVDREQAVGRAIDSARAGDVILLAGKGHETEQILKDRSIDFDERAVARRFLTRRVS